MKILSLGAPACQILIQQPEARLLGITSHGVFISTDLNWVLFLSRDAYRGPLTLNVDGMPGSLRERLGDPVAVLPGGLRFSKSNIWLSTEGAGEWNPSPPAGAALPPSKVLARLEDIARQIPIQLDPLTIDTLPGIAQGLKEKQVERVASLAAPLFGRGTGLTPAGDDLTMGLLLALNRWGSILYPGYPLETLNSLFIQEARSRTTTLSANLIECAARGQADERLIAGLDGLVTGIPDPAACASFFNDWGNTSGGNVFTGIKVALTCWASPGEDAFHSSPLPR